MRKKMKKFGAATNVDYTGLRPFANLCGARNLLRLSSKIHRALSIVRYPLCIHEKRGNPMFNPSLSFRPLQTAARVLLILVLLILLFVPASLTLSASSLDDHLNYEDEVRSLPIGYGPNVYNAATFTVNYRGPGDQGSCTVGQDGLGDLIAWPAEAKAAMNHAIDILDDLINSGPTIVVDACYQPDSTEGSLAAAGAAGNYSVDYSAKNGVSGTRSYAVALVNALDGVDNNGADPEISATVNSNQVWDYCTANCTVDSAKFDFVSTMVHELLHGLGFAMSFGVDNDTNPTAGNFSDPSGVTDYFVFTSAAATNPNQRLVDLTNPSQDLLNIFLSGSGKVEFRGPNTVAVNGFAPFIYSTAQWQQGSSMSHLDDNHPSNNGRMMNAATPEGPSSRTVDAMTLMFMKDIGWSVNDAADYGDAEMNAYGTAQHINHKAFANALWIGAEMTTEASAVSADASDDGVVAAVGNWSVGTNGATITVAVSSTPATTNGCLSVWVDWDNNSNFSDANDSVVSMRPIATGTNQSISFDVPAEAFTGNTARTLNARVRLQPDWDRDGTCSDQVAMGHEFGVFGGEVEDYQWGNVVLDKFIYLPMISR